MSVQTLLQALPVGVIQTDEAEGLTAIHRPGCAAVIWNRHPLPAFQTWIENLEPAQLPSARIILHPEQVLSSVQQICDVAATPPSPHRTRLEQDIAALAEIFANLMRARYLRLRLDVVNTDACRKFHVDAIPVRLVCTYRGTGTQYGTTNGHRDPEHILTTPTCAPIVLRGTQWPEHPRSGLVHRSPPIEGTGETRLLLVLDPVDDPDDAL